jgi:hypothetical protein
MTPQAQRIAIAEACGWTLNPAKHTAKGLDWLHAPSGNTAYNPPNYLNDLNAMHDAEKVLFGRNDWSSCKYDEYLDVATSSWKWNATASQRAEAFLRTIGKWEEAK